MGCDGGKRKITDKHHEFSKMFFPTTTIDAQTLSVSLSRSHRKINKLTVSYCSHEMMNRKVATRERETNTKPSVVDDDKSTT